MFSITKIPALPTPSEHSPMLLSECEIALECNSDKVQLIPMLKFPIGTKTQVVVGKISGYLGSVIDECLAKMNPGQKAEFCVDFSAVDCGKPATIIFSLQLFSASSGKEVYELSFAECLDLSQQWKSNGNACFKSNDISMAGHWYSKSLKILLACLNVEVPNEEYDRLLCQCHVNLAAVQLKREMFSHAVRNCSEALLIDCKMMKALYRRALANMSLGKLEDSIKDLRLALKLQPNSSSVRSLLTSVMDAMKKD